MLGDHHRSPCNREYKVSNPVPMPDILREAFNHREAAKKRQTREKFGQLIESREPSENMSNENLFYEPANLKPPIRPASHPNSTIAALLSPIGLYTSDALPVVSKFTTDLAWRPLRATLSASAPALGTPAGRPACPRYPSCTSSAHQWAGGSPNPSRSPRHPSWV